MSQGQTMADGNTEAAQKMLEWLLDKGLSVDSVTCGDCTVKLHRARGPLLTSLPMEGPDDDDGLGELGPDGQPFTPPTNAHAAYAQRMMASSGFDFDGGDK